MSNDWREKYLQLLDDQDRQEATHKRQLENIRQALVRVSLAAEGLDSELDSKLKGLRHVLRPQADKTPSLGDGQVQELEAAVLAFEGVRKQRSKQAQESFTLLSSQLKDLDLPKDIKSGLKRYQKGLKQRIERLQEYPSLLKEISSLQRQALDALAEQGGEKPGFFGRLFGDSGNSNNEDVASTEQTVEGAEHVEDLDAKQVDNTEHAEDIESEEADVNAETEGAPVDRSAEQSDSDHTQETPASEQDDETTMGEIIEGELSDEEPQTEAVFQRPLHEPAFSKISEKVTRVLTELLEQVEASPCVVQKVENAKERIDRGLNWFELVPTLEDIRDLVMQAYLEADSAHMDYLVAVNSELAEIYGLLGGAVDAEKLNREAGESLRKEMDTTLVSLSHSVANAGELQELRDQVSGQIEHIKDALSDYQQQQESEPEPLADQLQTLVERVQAMEADAKQNKEDFEEQRRMALEDALTGLPNRQAYNERIHHELQRWQRYEHPLTLAVADIDFFKRVNDTYGHQAGDRVLRVIGRAISKRLREVDFMARYGGEEFVLVMPETSAENALGILDKIRAALSETPFHFKEEPVQITLSIGVAGFAEGDTAESVFERADKALYEAKEGGRNQCRKI
mgnify:CR=1 FL=1